MAYACVCSSVKDSEVIEAIKNGCSTVEQLTERLNVCANCGCCYQYLLNLLEFYSSSK